MPSHFADEAKPLPEQVKTPVLCVRTRLRVAYFSSQSPAHRLGGPLALQVQGAKQPEPPLHRVLTLSLADPLIGIEIDGITELPLVYGFMFDGCRMTYRLIRDGVIEILEVEPDSPCDDWPYPGFPRELSEKRFAWIDDGTIAPEQVKNLYWQGFEGVDVEFDPTTAIVFVVPESAEYGVSLWGDTGEFIQVVFEVDPTRRIVRASNVCN